MHMEVTASATDNNENTTVTNFRDVILPGVSALSIRGKGFATKYKKKSPVLRSSFIVTLILYYLLLPKIRIRYKNRLMKSR